ncbi:MAG TPA: patatin-like phospholipase family protein, partial [Thermoanaerobaculia bacterium]
MYGPIAGRPPVHYDSVVDERWAVHRLRDCLIWKEGDQNVVDVLNELVDGKRSVTLLVNSPELTEEGKVLIESYDRYTDGVPEERKKELNRRIVDEAIGRSVKSLRDLRLNHVYKQLHAKDDNSARSALCISGGGIRSATFALGVIQGLASGRILDKFDYLSTVSGGGYIGSWLSSWARRHPDGITGVQEDLVRADTATGHKDLRPESKLEPEPHPMRHLREYSNYLSPRLGLTSADTWTMVALYLRNLMLNLLIIVPVLAALLAIPRLFAYFLNLAGRENLEGLIATSLAGLAIGFGYIGAMRPVAAGARADHKRWRTSDGKFLALCVLPLFVSAIALSLFWAEASQETTRATLGDFNRWRTGGLAIFLMTVWPAAIYYVRYFRASAAVRGDHAARRAHFGKHAAKKLAYETGGAVLGVLTAAVLLYVIATSLFPNPLQDVPRTAELLPFLRPLENSIPWAELYVCLAVPLVMLVFYVQAGVFVGISGKVNEDQDREWWGRAGAWLLITAGAVLFLCGIAVFGPVALYSAPAILGVSGAGAGG